MRERAIDAAELSLEVAHRESQDETKQLKAEVLPASSFMPVALKLLLDGKASDAASIYRAAVELRPDNYEALNYLGLCLSPTSPREAITTLEGCTRLPDCETTMLTPLNLAVAWFLAGELGRRRRLDTGSAFSRVRQFYAAGAGRERRAVREAIESLRLTPVMFEQGARPHPPRALYRAYLEQRDVFVGLYWERFGWVAPAEISSLDSSPGFRRQMVRDLTSSSCSICTLSRLP